MHDRDQPYTTSLLVTSDILADYGTGATLRISAHPVMVTTTGTVRNYVDSVTPEPWADLRITAQFDHVATQPYGWRVEYHNVYAVELARAEAMVKTLRKIERGLERLRAEFGYPESFAAYVARVAKVLGVKQFGWRSPDGGMFPNGTQYRWTDADGLASHVHTLVRDFTKEPVS
jgi:hypothetical protein